MYTKVPKIVTSTNTVDINTRYADLVMPMNTLMKLSTAISVVRLFEKGVSVLFWAYEKPNKTF